MKRLLLFLLLAASLSSAQTYIRMGPYPVSSVSATNAPYLVANLSPNLPQLAVCHSPANQVPCTNYLTTYQGTGVACSNGAQDTPDPNATTSACQPTGDAQGNVAFWALQTTLPYNVDYTVCIVGTVSCFLYTVTVPGSGSGSGSVTSVATSSPIGGGPITTTGAISFIPCATGQTWIWNGSVWACTTVATGSLPAAQIGDIIRWNVNGDSTWDAVNYGQASTGVYATLGGSTPIFVGPLSAGGGTQFSSHADIQATATVGPGETYTGAATASTLTLIGVKTGENGNNSIGPISAFYRFTTKLSIGSTTNVRYWIGLGCWTGSGGTGNNGAEIFGTNAYATNSPNKNTIAFRYAAGTDTHWQAVVDTAGGSQTTVDTGITPDTSIHLFELIPNAAGSSIAFFIDGVSVATISTNIPPVGNGGNSVMTLFFTGDNENTNNSVAANFYSMQMSLK